MGMATAAALFFLICLTAQLPGDAAITGGAEVSTVAAATSPSNSTVAAAAPTAYDFLDRNRLPRGLLPKGVLSYTIQPSDGKMEVTLSDQCDFPVNVGGRAYKMRFGSKVGGIVKPGSIAELYGVRVQVTYRWLGISAIDRAGDKIVFSVRDTSPLSFPASSFAVSPSCSA